MKRFLKSHFFHLCNKLDLFNLKSSKCSDILTRVHKSLVMQKISKFFAAVYFHNLMAGQHKNVAYFSADATRKICKYVSNM